MEALSFNSLDGAIAGIFGNGIRVTGRQPVYGGDINESWRLSLSNGTNLFMKCNTMANAAFFRAEAKGLAALGDTEAIGVPRVYCMGTDKGMGISFLIMEYLAGAPRVANYWETFGRELAAMHRADTSNALPAAEGRTFGFTEDNYIGATPQKNAPMKSWVSFFRERRLSPQMSMAERHLDHAARKKCVKLLDNLERYLPEPEFPSLIHGDLWSGNAVAGPDGKAWILDPAAYVGHFEAELAMTELFGGFPSSFYDAYSEANPISGGYRDRKDLYNLYHMLNHLNLFGRSYLGSVKRILDRYA